MNLSATNQGKVSRYGVIGFGIQKLMQKGIT
jgi:hypothetical protein